VHLTGSLDGGPEREYVIRLPQDAFEIVECDTLYLPMLGADHGGGTLLTEQGALHITDARISFGSRDTFGLIDTRSSEISYALAPRWEKYFWGATPAVSDDLSIHWRKDDVCLQLEGGDLFAEVPLSRCEGVRLFPADPADVERVRASGVVARQSSDHSPEGLALALQRVEGTPYLLYTYPVACT